MEENITPKVLTTSGFVAARVAEIKSIVNQLEDCDHGRRAFQTLPRHMQRRQVSSNPRRLPKYLREQHKREQGGNSVKITRRPSRKHRRRPRNLLDEYNRRQKDHVWLESHIWHAKRFHMIKRWGYTLPDASTCKGYRSSIRAAKTSCLVQDVSYISCIELEGNLSLLLTGLSRITQPSCLAALTRPKVKQGQQWEVVTIFKPDVQPCGALGDVDILCLPSSPPSENPSGNAKLWIWVHPSAHSHVVEVLVDIYDLLKIENVSEQASDFKDKKEENGESVENVEGVIVGDDQVVGDQKVIPVQDSVIKDCQQPNGARKRKNESTEDPKRDNKRCKDVNGKKLAKRNIPFERTPKYRCDSTQVSMTLLKDTFTRIRLTGPESISVLKAALIPASLPIAEATDDGGLSEDKGADKAWWRDYYGDETKRKFHLSQVEAWEKLSTSHLDNRMVLPLTVRDPRVTLPRKKCPIKSTKSTKDTNKATSCPVWPENSPLYTSGIRDRVTLSKEPDAEVNSRRSQLLIPGSHLPECPEESRLPVLMLSRPRTHSLGHGTGLDVVVCAGWGMSLLLPIALNGGVVGGQKAAENLYMEFLTPLTPNLLPDTPSGEYHSSVVGQERHTEYFKRPPACRSNFIKLGVQYPFSSPWRKLTQDWAVGSETLSTLRNPVLLQYLSTLFGHAFEAIRRRSANSKDDDGDDDDAASVVSSVQSVDLAVTEGSDELQDCKIVKTDTEKLDETTVGDKAEERVSQLSKCGCLVKVKLILEDKGSLESCAMICLPQKEDLTEKDRGPKDKTPGVFMEPVHIDTQQEDRKNLKREHNHIKDKIHRMRTKTKLKLEKEAHAAGVVERGEGFKKLTQVALERLQENNKVLFTKHTSYNTTMEDLWLMKKDGPLQCCSRKIMGYITNGNFSMTIGRGAGIGWVALKPLLDCLQINRDAQSDTDADSNRYAAGASSVLVRNPSTLEYYRAKLYIVK